MFSELVVTSTALVVDGNEVELARNLLLMDCYFFSNRGQSNQELSQTHSWCAAQKEVRE